MLKKSFWVSSLSLLVSIISFVNQIFIAKLFGTSQQLEAYLSISALPNFIAAIISSALSFSLIPYLLNIKNEEKGQAHLHASILIRKLLFIAAGIVVVAGMLFFFFGRYIYNNIQVDGQFYTITAITWITCFFMIWSSVYGCLLNVETLFIKSVALNFFPYLFAILFCVIAHSIIGITSLPVGLLIGNIVSVIIGIKSLPFRLAGAQEKRLTPSMQIFLKNIPIVAIAMFCFTIYQSVDAFWAPTIGASNLSYLSYCQRILTAFGTLVIAGPSALLVPHLSKALSENREDDFFRSTITIVKTVLVIAVFFVVLVSVLAVPIVQLMFQRGAFTAIDTAAVAGIMPYMFTGMAFMLNVVILFRVSFLRNMHRVLCVLGIASLLLYFFLSWIGVKQFQLKGITYAYIVTWLIVLIVLLLLLFQKKSTAYFLNKENVFFVSKLLLIVCITKAVCLLLIRYCPLVSVTVFLQLVFELGFVSIGAGAAFIASVRLFNIREMQPLLQKTFLRFPVAKG